MSQGTAFFAYPAENPTVRAAIKGAAELECSAAPKLLLWEKINILGFQIDKLIRTKIYEADFLAADITKQNQNVFYEIGYALACGKPVLPTIHAAIANARENVQRLGLFDTTGYADYNNAEELCYHLQRWEKISWRNMQPIRRNFAQPLFVLDSFIKTDFRNWIFHAIDESLLRYRVFDPAEIPRLTASQALDEISASAGVIIPLVSTEIVDAHIHNLRAGFVLGLAHGCGIDALVIQYESSPIPIDYRDFVKNSTSRIETIRHVLDYCQQTLINNQRPSNTINPEQSSILTEIYLGSPSAENESSYLHQYFVETAEYAKAARAESAIVTGRKGSGKSAIYYQVAEQHRRTSPRNCVIDLRPASHDLSGMRESLLSVMSAGVFDHTIAAFWQYIFYFEILLKIRELVLPKSKNDFSLQEKIASVETQFGLNEQIVSGDFTSRLKTAVDLVVSYTQDREKRDKLRQELTNMMFEKPIPELRKAIIEFSPHYEEIHLLIDDLDKGWPPRRVEDSDITMVRHLIETLNRIRRDLSKKNVEMSHLIFLRSDIYEKLVEITSDRGKYNVINVDWSDELQLENMIKVRVFSSVSSGKQEDAWNSLNSPMKEGDTILKLISSSLMRPRFLIDLCGRVLSFAINRGHSKVKDIDVEDAIKQMSLYLVSDFGYEMRDVSGTSEDIFYFFIGAPERMSRQNINEILQNHDSNINTTETIDLLLWYGFLGIISANGSETFIYDRAYDFRRLEAEIRSRGDKVEYIMNPAFISGLK